MSGGAIALLIVFIAWLVLAGLVLPRLGVST